MFKVIVKCIIDKYSGIVLNLLKISLTLAFASISSRTLAMTMSTSASRSFTDPSPPTIFSPLIPSFLKFLEFYTSIKILQNVFVYEITMKTLRSVRGGRTVSCKNIGITWVNTEIIKTQYTLLWYILIVIS